MVPSQRQIVSEFFYNDYTRTWPKATPEQMQEIYFHEFDRLLHALTQKQAYYQEFARDYRLAAQLRSNIPASTLKKTNQPTDARHQTPFYIPPTVDQQPYTIAPTAKGVEFKYYGKNQLCLSYRAFFNYLEHYVEVLAKRFDYAYNLQQQRDQIKPQIMADLADEARNPNRTEFAQSEAALRLKVMRESGSWLDRIHVLRSRHWHQLFDQVTDVLAFWRSNKVPGNPNAHFPEARKLALMPGDIVSFKQLDCANTLKTLTADGLTEATDLEELGKYTSLKSLALRDMGIKDISFVAHLTSLDELIIGGNNVKDLEPIRGLPRLSHLYLACGNPITNFEVLESLPNLQNVFIDDTQATYEELSKLSLTGTINYLHVTYLEPKKLANGASLPQISVQILERFEPQRSKQSSPLLYVGRTQLDLKPGDIKTIKSMQCAASLTSLTMDAIYNCQALNELENYTLLRSLTMRHMKLENIGFVSKLTDLEQLNLANNCIQDISPLQGLPHLTHLYLAGNPIQDLSILKTLPQLKTVFVDATTPWQNLKLSATLFALKLTPAEPLTIHNQKVPRFKVEIVATVPPSQPPTQDPQATKATQASSLAPSQAISQAQAPVQAQSSAATELPTAKMPTILDSENGSASQSGPGTQFGPGVQFGPGLQSGPRVVTLQTNDVGTCRSFDEEGCNCDAQTHWQKTANQDPRRLNIRDRYLYSGLSNSLGHAPAVLYDISKVKHLDCSNSIHLSVDHTFLDQAGDFSCLTHATRLRSLCLDDRLVNDFDWIRNCRNLTDLSLARTNISDLSPLYALPNLKRLNLSGCTQLKLDDEAISWLQRIPNLEVDKELNATIFEHAFTMFIGLCQDYKLPVTLRLDSETKLKSEEILPPELLAVYRSIYSFGARSYQPFVNKVQTWDGTTAVTQPQTSLWLLNAKTPWHPLAYPWIEEFKDYGIKLNEYDQALQEYRERSQKLYDKIGDLYLSTLSPNLSQEKVIKKIQTFVGAVEDYAAYHGYNEFDDYDVRDFDEDYEQDYDQDAELSFENQDGIADNNPFMNSIDEPIRSQILDCLHEMSTMHLPVEPRLNPMWRNNLPFLVTHVAQTANSAAKLHETTPHAAEQASTQAHQTTPVAQDTKSNAQADKLNLQASSKGNQPIDDQPSSPFLKQGYQLYLLGLRDGRIYRLVERKHKFDLEPIAPNFVYFMINWPELILPSTLKSQHMVWCP